MLSGSHPSKARACGKHLQVLPMPNHDEWSIERPLSTSDGTPYDFVRTMLMRSGLLGLALSALSALAACGGSDGSSGNSAGTGQCQAACARCGGDPCLDCAAYSARFRDEFEATLFSCVQNAASCSSAQWQTCSSQAGVQAPSRPIDDQYRSACLAKRTTCGGSVFADDYCLSSRVFEESLVTAANKCLAQDCTTVKACLSPIFQ